LLHFSDGDELIVSESWLKAKPFSISHITGDRPVSQDERTLTFPAHLQQQFW